MSDWAVVLILLALSAFLILCKVAMLSWQTARQERESERDALQRRTDDQARSTEALQ